MMISLTAPFRALSSRDVSGKFQNKNANRTPKALTSALFAFTICCKEVVFR